MSIGKQLLLAFGSLLLLTSTMAAAFLVTSAKTIRYHKQATLANQQLLILERLNSATHREMRAAAEGLLFDDFGEHGEKQTKHLNEAHKAVDQYFRELVDVAAQEMEHVGAEGDEKDDEEFVAFQRLEDLHSQMSHTIDTVLALDAKGTDEQTRALFQELVHNDLEEEVVGLIEESIEDETREVALFNRRVKEWTANANVVAIVGSLILLTAAIVLIWFLTRSISQIKLSESHAHIRNIFGSMVDMLVVVAADGSIATVNKATCSLLGYQQEELIGQSATLLFSEEEEEELATMIVSRKALPGKGRMLRDLISVGHVSGVEGWYRAKDGSKVPVSFSGSVMRDDQGEVQGIVCVAQDNTERKQLLCELAHAQKLESVGQLAAGIAHEINTPTQYVGNNTRFLKEAFGDMSSVLNKFEKLLQAAKDGTMDEQLVAETEATLEQADVEYLTEEIPQAIDQSLNGVERVAKIVRAMKEFSHPGSEEKSLVNLREAIETTITVARNEWKYVAEMVTDFDPALPTLSCLPGELNQVFLNLIVNAAHAIGDALGDDATERGMITVGTRRDGEQAEIFVRDTGTGIPEDVRAKVFDPFFTTKEVGKGTGQGLTIARSVVVDKHGGSIECETQQGKGTTFIVRLPIDGKRQTQGGSEHEDASSIR